MENSPAPATLELTGLSLLGSGRARPIGQPTAAVNPATGQELETGFFAASPDTDVEEAARLAESAFAEYRHWPAVRRAALLRKIAARLEGNADAIIARANLETALPLARLQGEMGRTCGQLRLFAAWIEEGSWRDARIDHTDPNRQPLPKPDVRSMMVPLGPVAVFGASNFPLAFSVPGGDTASALAAGCPVIVKSHEGHPGTSELVGLAIGQAARECGAPEGIFSLLHGGREVGVALVRHPAVRAVGFTGSLRAGRALMDAAAARPQPIPVYAEMGSVNPVFLLRGALAERADKIAAGLHASVTLGVGQFCTNPGLVFVESGEHTAGFLQKLAGLIEGTPAGTMLTANICTGFRDGIERLDGTEGVHPLARVQAGEGQGGASLFTTDAATFQRNHALTEEVFGPATLVVECASRDELLACAQRLEGQLTATVHATPQELGENRALLDVLTDRAGRVLYNGFPTGVEVCHAMNHGGPYPAASDGRSTSVGTRAIARFVRPVCFQDFPDEALPDELKETNPLGLPRLVDGKLVQP